MLDLKDVYYFAQVVDHGGFTSAGAVLGLRKSTLSNRIKALETSLGVRLINRSARHFAMTEPGAEFYQYALALLQSAHLAEDAVRHTHDEPCGVVRVTSPVEVSQYLLRDVLPTFLRRYPQVTVQENATDRIVDIASEGFDLAIRGHSIPLNDTDLMQRPIAHAPWCLFAAPDYLEQMPDLGHPEQLQFHAVISLFRDGPPEWHLQGPHDRLVTVPIVPRFQSNNLISLKEAACAKLGIAPLPGYMCRAELKAGLLQQVLPGWIAADARISALIPRRNGHVPAVQALVDFLAEAFPRITAFDDHRSR
ncbi:LysR substrate-binding domain-containing protein [Paraburkholderia jirisanensis]